MTILIVMGKQDTPPPPITQVPAEQDNMRFRITLSVTIISSLLTISFAIMNLRAKKYYAGILEMAGGLFMLFFNLYHLLKRKNCRPPIIIITMIIMFIATYLYWNGGFGKTGIYWFFTMPPLVISLHQPKSGLILVTVQLIIILILFFLSLTQFLAVAYNRQETVTAIVVYCFISYILLYYEHSKSRYKKEIKTLQGLLPICSHCKKIRDNEGHWQPVDAYINRKADVSFSHGICPDCLKTLYPNEVDEEGNIKSDQ